MMQKIAIGCQGGGAHGAFEVGVLTRILQAYRNNENDLKNKIELVAFSGTSAGALNALMVWYGLAPKLGTTLSADELVSDAINGLNTFWDDFAAKTEGDILLNSITTKVLELEEEEIKPLGFGAPAFRVNPYGLIYKAVAASLPQLGVRRRYFDLEYLLNQYCPALVANNIDWPKVKSRLLIGASEVLNGFETVFDSDIYKGRSENTGRQSTLGYWSQRLRFTLQGVEASGTLPTLRKGEHIGNGVYWDGLYSQNPPLDFFSGVNRDDKPDELWILRINPQQWPGEPNSNADIKDRQNELMGNLSLNKDLDSILRLNYWITRYAPALDADCKSVKIRTIKMRKETVDNLRYSSKFNRSRDLIDELREEGRQVADGWISGWPNNGEYPNDAAYP